MIVRIQNGIDFLTGGWPLVPNRPTLVFIHGAGHVTLGGAGHMSPLEQPEAFNSAFDQFPDCLVR